jgi:hypothetical protein
LVPPPPGLIRGILFGLPLSLVLYALVMWLGWMLINN